MVITLSQLREKIPGSGRRNGSFSAAGVLPAAYFHALSTIVQKIATTPRNPPPTAILPQQGLVPGLLLLCLEEPTSAAWSADDPSLPRQSGDLAMKKTLFILCLLSATAAFAQFGGSLNSQPQAFEFPSHPAHAAYTPMSPEQSVLASSSYTSAQGERPPSDFPQAEAVSLGAYAREIRKQHAQLKKSSVVWANQ